MSRSRPLWKHVVAVALLILVIQRIGFRVLGAGPAGSLFIDIFAITANILAIACPFLPLTGAEASPALFGSCSLAPSHYNFLATWAGPTADTSMSRFLRQHSFLPSS